MESTEVTMNDFTSTESHLHPKKADSTESSPGSEYPLEKNEKKVRKVLPDFDHKELEYDDSEEILKHLEVLASQNASDSAKPKTPKADITEVEVTVLMSQLGTTRICGGIAVGNGYTIKEFLKGTETFNEM